MSDVSRFSNGLTNVAGDHPFAHYLAPYPGKMHTYFNDFDTYVAGDWTVTKVEAGAGSATQALTDGDGGLLLLTNDAADDDSTEMQKVGESFRMASGKKAWFEARFKTSDATQSDIYMGLIITDTTVAGGVSDGIYFKKADGAATVDIISEMNTTETPATSIATLANDTFVTLTWYYDGDTKLYYSVDGTVKGAVTVAAGTTLCNDEDLTVTMTIQNGEAAAKTMTVDYILAAKAR